MRLEKTIRAHTIVALNKLVKKYNANLTVSKPYKKVLKRDVTVRLDIGCFAYHSDKVAVELIDVVIEYPTPVGEYSLIAISKGGIIHVFNKGYDTQVVRQQKSTCEHCQTNRQRKNFYIIEKNGVLKTVGSECMKDLVGVDTLNSFITYHAVGKSLESFINDTPVDDDELILSNATYNTRVVFRDNCPDFTMELFNDIFKADTSYCFNVRLAMSQGFQARQTRLIESAIDVFNKEAIKRKTAPTLPEIEIGSKFKAQVVCVAYRQYEHAYGISHIYTFNNGMVWKSSNEQIIELDQEITLQGTVKGINEFQGVKTMAVTRCKVIS